VANRLEFRNGKATGHLLDPVGHVPGTAVAPQLLANRTAQFLIQSRAGRKLHEQRHEKAAIVELAADNEAVGYLR